VNLEERILVLAPIGRDGPLAQRALAVAGMDAHVCRDVAELCAELEVGAGAALLTPEALVDGAVPKLAAALQSQPAWSDFPVVLFAGADLPELRGLANLTVLERPVRVRTLLSAIRSALRARRRQYETRAMMDELRRSVRARDQFLAMLGHELRNPIAAVLTASEIMERTRNNGVREREIIARQARHLGQLVDDLLDVARVTSGKITLRATVVELHELLRGLLPEWETNARELGLSFSLIAPGTPVEVKGDPMRLEQVLTNLVGNALKYTPAGGRIAVSLTTDGDDALIEVSDTGIGMDVQTLPLVFDLFSQAEGALDRAKGGMGIGLTVVKRLVELHHGTVAARSQGRGRGSSFEVRIPLCREVPCAKATNGKEVVPRRRRVLLVEDNPDTREVLQLALEQAGHEVVTSADGVEAFEVARRHHPEAMLIDIGLPGQDGYELAREVRGALGSEVRLIALTGYGQAEDRRRALEAGFDEHLIKPVDLDTLEEALDFGDAA
jgi:signal transduction histidine kinase/CheY-like chemotaxis protein